MATEIHNQSGRGDNYAILWATLIVLAAIILGYIAYASYYRTDNYSMPSSSNNSTLDNGNTNTGTTTKPSTNPHTTPNTIQ
jgi:hypothetical protein